MTLLMLVCLVTVTALEAAIPPVPRHYRPFFTHFEDKRSFPEKVSNALGLEGKPVGRSHALIAGVSDYRAMNQRLEPADVDLRKLQAWSKLEGQFDEVVVLRDDAFNEKNLNYFLKEYFPKRVNKFPRSRFLFAFTGHGALNQKNSYLLTTESESFKDTVNAVEIGELRIKLNKTLSQAHQSLVLINSCYGGAFVTTEPFGNTSFLPTGPGTHAITAGRANEKVYADRRVGPGSVFFETFLSALSGRADSLPTSSHGQNGDGIITIDELASYLSHQIKNRSQLRVNPLFADLAPNGSKGGFFFLTKDTRVTPNPEPDPQPPGIPMGGVARFVQVTPTRVQDRLLNCEWSLLSQGNYADWKKAVTWTFQAGATLPSSEHLRSLISKTPDRPQPITLLLSQFDIPRIPNEFWSSTKRGRSPEVLNNVSSTPRITKKNPEDTCGVLAILSN